MLPFCSVQNMAICIQPLVNPGETGCSGACSSAPHLTALCAGCSRYKRDVRCLLWLCFRQGSIPGMGLFSALVGLGAGGLTVLEARPFSAGAPPVLLLSRRGLDWLMGSSCEQIPCLQSKTKQGRRICIYQPC